MQKLLACGFLGTAREGADTISAQTGDLLQGAGRRKERPVHNDCKVSVQLTIAQWHHAAYQNTLPDHSWIKLFCEHSGG